MANRSELRAFRRHTLVFDILLDKCIAVNRIQEHLRRLFNPSSLRHPFYMAKSKGKGDSSSPKQNISGVTAGTGGRGSLAAAHRGYTYQDAVFAFLMANCVAEQTGTLTANRLIHPADKFDDIGEFIHGRHIRRQIKHSHDTIREFQISDVRTSNHRASIADLVRSHRDADKNLRGDEYRLCATWLTPTYPEFSEFFEEVTVESTFALFSTSTFRLKPDAVWPEGGSPLWRPLRTDSDITRHDLACFAERFVLELGCPRSSGDFNRPGPLESAILQVLRERIGFGRYPNRDRSPLDAATSLMLLSQKARSEELTLNVADIEKQLDLRKDFGRVAQQFPIDVESYVRRATVQDDLRQLIEDRLESETGQTLLITGMPGAGKSWILERLSDEMRVAGHLVARHFCYLEPGDAEVQLRITTDVLWANLIGELTDQDAKLRGQHQPVYAADMSALERLLSSAVETNPARRIVIFVDGLDHITRVHGDVPSLSFADVDIIEQISLLSLPRGVVLVACSQPGAHLEKLQVAAQELTLPLWKRDDIAMLATLLGLLETLRSAGLLITSTSFHPTLAEREEVSWQELVDTLDARAEGNPLYATYMCREMLLLKSGAHAQDWRDKLSEMPPFQGGLANYYDFLLSGIESEDPLAGYAAELLGVVDFGLTEIELAAMFPQMAHRISHCVNRLRPILTQPSAQGGWRVYHESFRRYILERLHSRGQSLSDALEPVIRWLTDKDFYFDVKSYRFLLPTLRRANRTTEITNCFTVDFVAKSIAACQPRPAISANLSLGMAVVTESKDWAKVCRLIHLQLASSTFEQKLQMADYGRTFAILHGASALVERLLFDGRPTMIRQEGLILCELCDEMGEVAPWEEYLGLPDNTADGSYQSHFREQEYRATFRGQIHQSGWAGVKRGLARWLEQYGRKRQESKGLDGKPSRSTIYEDYPLKTVREYLRAVSQVVGPDAVSELYKLLPKGRAYTHEIAALIDIESASEYRLRGSEDRALSAIKRAGTRELTVELAAECAEYGADISGLKLYEADLRTLSSKLNSSNRCEPFLVDSWVAATKLLSWTSPDELERAPDLIGCAGWYGQWLRFAARLAFAESRLRSNSDVAGDDSAEALVVSFLGDLARDIHPYRGSPRTIDLFQIHDCIEKTFARAFELIQSHSAWEAAVPLLQRIARDTTTWIDRHPSGPLTMTTLSELMLTPAARPSVQTWLTDVIDRQISDWQRDGQYYEAHAENEMVRARALSASGQGEAAQRAWCQAAIFLSAHGFRKDIVLLDLTETLPLLAKHDSERVKRLCARIQNLADYVVMHTDGRSTKRMPLYWFDTLLEIDSVGASQVLGTALRARGGQVGWLADGALAHTINDARKCESVNPLTIAFLDASRPFPSKSRADADDVLDECRNRLNTVEKLLSATKVNGADGEQRAAWAESCLLNFFSQIDGDGPTYVEETVELVRECARRHDIPLPPQREYQLVVDIQTEANEDSWDAMPPRPVLTPPDSKPVSFHIDEPLFPSKASPSEILARVRQRVGQFSSEQPGANPQFINAFGYRLVELIESDMKNEAMRLIRHFAHDAFFTSAATPLEELGQGLERNGHHSVAAFAFALAYARSRGGQGYQVMGGADFEHWLLHALRLDKSVALDVLFAEIRSYAEREWYNGLTQNIIEFCARHVDVDIAFLAWDEVCQILEFRLPDTGTSYQTFDAYRPEYVPHWSRDEATAFLLLSRISHPEFVRRTAGLVGVCALLSTEPQTLAAPLQESIRVDITQTTGMVLLQAISFAEVEPFPITALLKDELQALLDTPHFGLRFTAQHLLKRAGFAIEPSRPIPRAEAHDISKRASRERALWYDWGNRIESLSMLWPELPMVVSSRFDILFSSSPSYSDRNEGLLFAMQSPGDRNIPATPCFLWTHELFENAFQETLSEIEDEFLKIDEWTENTPRLLLNDTAPPVALHAARWHSRIPRPDMPSVSTSAREESSDEGRLPDSMLYDPEIVEEDGCCAGWTRLALVDEEILNRVDSQWDKDVERRIRVTEGVLAIGSPKEAVESEDSVFGNCRHSEWWLSPDDVLSAYGTLTDNIQGPLVGMAMLKDPIGYGPLFILHPKIVAWLGLTPGRWPGMLHCIDESGEMGLVFRHWSMRPIGSEIYEQAPRFRGCDLLLRTDLFDRVSDFLRFPLCAKREFQYASL